MITRTFHVEGMTCASCLRRVEKSLGSVPGVARVSVNFATEEAQVVGQFDEADLVSVLEARGYGLRPIELSLPTSQRAALLRLVLAWVMTFPLMASMLPGVHLHLPWFVQALLAAVTTFGTGSGFFARAWQQLRKGETTMDTLVALGSGVAWGFGLKEALEGATHTSFETAAALVAFLLTGKYLEAAAKHRATHSLSDLIALAPAMATRLDDAGNGEEVPTSELQPGDRVLVKPGHAIPVDGVVREGAADVDLSFMTGEPLPSAKGPGDEVLAGSIIFGGSLEVEVHHAGKGTWLARLARHVAEAQGSRTPVQDLADRVSAVFVPVILLIALATFVVWLLIHGSVAQAWRPAVTALVIACPCALGLATPVASAVALGTAARVGLLVRNAAGLEALGRVTDIVLDKTGTLTEGKPRVTEILSLETGTSQEILRLAAALERGSEHPIAKGIVEAAGDAPIPQVTLFRAYPGGGVSGVVNGRELRLGSSDFLGRSFPGVLPSSTAVGLMEADNLLGILVLADTVRSEAPDVLHAFRKYGITIHLQSGDRPQVVADLARRLSIPHAHGACAPMAKRDYVKELQLRGRVVAFAGDGVNDGPALAQADAGISLPGLEATRATAPLNLLRDGLMPLLKAYRLAKRAKAITRQNLIWAFGYNLVLVPLAAFNVLDTFGGPMLAGAAMGLSSLTVVLNALRLRKA